MKYPAKLTNFPRFTAHAGAVAGLALCSVGIWAAVKYKVAEALFSSSFFPTNSVIYSSPD